MGLRCWWALWLALRACRAGDLALPATAELRTVDAPELSSLIEQELRREWKVQEGQLTVSFDRAAPEIRIPAGETTLRWVTRQPQPMRRLFPQFELVVQGRVVGRYACQVQVEWLKDVWVAEASLVAQSPIGSDTLKRQRMDVLSLQGFLVRGSAIRGMQCHRSHPRRCRHPRTSGPQTPSDPEG